MRKRQIFDLSMVLGILLFTSVANSQEEITIGFDGLPDLSLDVDDFGVAFTGAQVLACGGSLNCGPFPPFSGDNVIFDQPGFGGVILADFDPMETGRVDKVSGRVTGNTNVTLTAFDGNGAVLGSDQTGGANFVGSGSGIPANKLLQIEVDLAAGDEPIARVTFSDGGNTFTVDDFTFRGSRLFVVLDPGHGQLLRNGMLVFQRPLSPTFGIVEDELTLQISNEAVADLEQADARVLLTRTGSLAPYAPENCDIPCFADINKRRMWAEKQEPDLMVSVHTNGADAATANGSESFYSSSAPSPDSQSLSQFVLDDIVALGLRDRGVKQRGFNIINSADFPSTLIEVAFHTNSELGTGQTITDEARLNSPAFRAAAGAAISQGVQDYDADSN